jgi:hypothetical protein
VPAGAVVGRLPGMTRPVVLVDPLYEDPAGADRMVELCRRFGRYRLYAEHERIDIDLGRGLLQRHDSVANFLRTGGARGGAPDRATLGARTSYFREEYAYGADERIAGIGEFLHHPQLAAGARAVHDRAVVEPAIAYANLMLPGQELAVHTDVPEFRGANRKVLPQWLLVVMHHSGLFDPWRLHIATGIAWFQDSSEGALRYWPDGPASPAVAHHVAANTAMVLDTDSVFHGVDPMAPDQEPPATAPGSTLAAGGGGDGDGDDDRWVLTGPDGAVVGDYGWDDLRFSVSWKAYCFADEAERHAWRTHRDDLTVDAVVQTLVDDMVARGRIATGDPVDRALGLAMIDEYVRYPAAPVTAQG